jgi:uncharacterized protein YbjT (DUF2867 family)
MKVLLFGATGMVGQGVLRECLTAVDMSLVQTVARSRTGQPHSSRLRTSARSGACGPTESIAGIHRVLFQYASCPGTRFNAG